MPYLTPDSLPADSLCRMVRIPNDERFIYAVSGALSELIQPQVWEAFGAVTPDDAAAAALAVVLDYFESDCMIGAICALATENTPANMLLCDGVTYLRVDYPKLYDQIDSNLVIDADTFMVPDLRLRYVGGAGAGFPPLSIGGVANVTLTEAQLPAHVHTTLPHTHPEGVAVAALINGGLEAPAAAAVPAPGVTGGSVVAVEPTGGGQSHTNLPPYIALKWAIIAQ